MDIHISASDSTARLATTFCMIGRSTRDRWNARRRVHLLRPVCRECLDRMMIFGEAHLRHILTLYAFYYNESRTRLSLHKDTPLGRAVQRYGNIAATPVLSGLHHRYARI
jgi:hypothetical protein